MALRSSFLGAKVTLGKRRGPSRVPRRILADGTTLRGMGGRAVPRVHWNGFAAPPGGRSRISRVCIIHAWCPSKKSIRGKLDPAFERNRQEFFDMAKNLVSASDHILQFTEALGTQLGFPALAFGVCCCLGSLSFFRSSSCLADQSSELG